MKTLRNKSVLIVIAVFAMILVACLGNKTVYAAGDEVLTVEAKATDAGITASGTTEGTVLAVQVQVFDAKTKELVAIYSTETTADQKYSCDVSVESGEYIVKAANFDGGNFKETNVTVGSGKSTETKTVTKTTTKTSTKTNTGDSNNLLPWVILFIIGGAGAGTVALKRRSR